ncbi:protein shisa-5-like isoform X3 [Embiotoca jacksoni]|uniref:protein shisa-5-like isoform X3 n=1 Tax=Embiotoca jacksoni TaxID=100190 RepID=UPI0037047DF8
MASGLSCVVVFALCVILSPCVSGDNDCQAYRDISSIYHSTQRCFSGFCCGSCSSRYCCHNSFLRFNEDAQDECSYHVFSSNSPVPMIVGVAGTVISVLIFICCCVCPCCCLYKMCRKPRPVIATTTHTTVVTTTPQQYPQQPTAAPGPPMSYQYPPYHSVPVQPGYGAQPMPILPYQGQPFTPGPPPTYQEATGPAYPPQPMPYGQAAFSPGQAAFNPGQAAFNPGQAAFNPGQAAFNPGQPAYPLHPPAQPQPNAPAAHTDFLGQPAYNPDYVAPPP